MTVRQIPLDFRPHGVETQREAAAAIPLGRKLIDRQKALYALVEAGPDGATDFDLERMTGVKQTSIGKRRLELERDGLVTRRLVWQRGPGGSSSLVGDKRPSPTGANAAVYVLTRWADPARRPRTPAPRRPA